MMKNVFASLLNCHVLNLKSKCIFYNSKRLNDYKTSALESVSDELGASSAELASPVAITSL